MGEKIIRVQQNNPDYFAVVICGDSMEPILHNGQYVFARRKEKYKIGDILVFEYKHQTKLVHRLLKVEMGRYFCKGDNSFRVEDFSPELVMGSVVLPSDPHNNLEFVADSLKISSLFRYHGYDINKIMDTKEYIYFLQKHF